MILNLIRSSESCLDVARSAELVTPGKKQPQTGNMAGVSIVNWDLFENGI
jgi:hypothetical protein